MRRAAFCLLGLVTGYVLGAGLGAMGIELLSHNTHDKSVEVAMTSALISGPIGAVVGLVVGCLRGK